MSSWLTFGIFLNRLKSPASSGRKEQEISSAILGLESTYTGYTEGRPGPSLLVGMDSEEPLNQAAAKVRKQGFTRMYAMG